MQDDPNIDRDNKGRDGAKQLWVPKKRQSFHSDVQLESDPSTEVVAEVSKNGQGQRAFKSTAWCVTCDQGPNDQDRDAPPGKKCTVKWFMFGDKRLVFPAGKECYPCFSVRRKFWAEKDQEALNTLLEGDTNEKDTHAEARRLQIMQIMVPQKLHMG